MRKVLSLAISIAIALTASALEINVEKAGTLPEKIDVSEKYSITELTVTGNINGTDIRFIREMAGSDYFGEPTEGKLSVLNLKEAHIEAGEPYFYSEAYDEQYAEEDYIGPFMFMGCSSLTEFTMPDAVSILGMSAFQDCYSLTTFNFNNILKVVGPYVFASSAVVEIILPDSVEEVWYDAFYCADKLTKLYFGASMESWENCCYGCTSLECYEVSPENPYFHVTDGVLFSSIEDWLLAYPQAKEGHYDVPEGTEAIFMNAFYCSPNPKSITFPESLSIVQDCAFQECGIESIDFGEGVIELGSYAIANCQGIKELKLPDSLEYFGYAALSNNLELETVSFGNNVSYIPDYLFVYDSALKNVKFSESLTDIGEGAFSCCNSLEELDFGTNLLTIGNYAFQSCNNLQKADLPEGIKSIGDMAFGVCNFTSLLLPSTVEKIGWGAFSSNYNLTTVTSMATVPPICGDEVFWNIDNDITLYVPGAAIESYKAAPVWKDFYSILPIETGIKPMLKDGLKIKIIDDGIIIDGNDEQTVIFSNDGKIVYSGVANGSTIWLSSGIYHVNINGNATKVFVK